MTRRISVTLVWFAFVVTSAAVQLRAQMPEPNVAVLSRVFFQTMGDRRTQMYGTAGMADSRIHPDLYILRQSGCTDYEKPFVYLLFGKQRALLVDTGSHHGKPGAKPFC